MTPVLSPNISTQVWRMRLRFLRGKRNLKQNPVAVRQYTARAPWTGSQFLMGQVGSSPGVEFTGQYG